MRRGETFRFRSLAVVAIGLASVAVGCSGDTTPRDANDTTPPTIAISVAGTRTNPGGIDDLQFGSTTELATSGAQVFVKASDDNGVGSVEIWMTEKRQCAGSVSGPGLAGAPVASAQGDVTSSQAPSTLTAIYRVDGTRRQQGCVFTFEVWGEADNAANTPVHAKSATVTLTLRT